MAYSQHHPAPHWAHTPVRSLPPSFQACLARQAGGATPTTTCDQAVGSIHEARGWCADARYAGTAHCACVNSYVGNPQCTLAACSGNPGAYRTVAMAGDQALHGCPAAVGCATVRAAGGADYLTPGLLAPVGCYGLRYQLVANYPLIVFVLLAVTVVALLAAATRRSSAQYRYAAGPGDGGPRELRRAAAGV